MEIKHIFLEEIKAYDNNPLNHPQEQIDKLARIIQEFGFKVPILLDSKMTIIAGHGRALAAQRLGLEEIPCIIADDLTEDQIKAFRIADNKIREGASWDMELLQEELLSIEDKFDLGLLAIAEEELTELMRNTSFDEEIEEDEVPEVDEVNPPFSKEGDLWLLGRHRLFCGDSTKKGNVVIDPFGGSGSTLVTCEQIDRIARTIEFDPKYADVIVKRYHSMEAGEIKLIRDGLEYNWEELKENFE